MTVAYDEQWFESAFSEHDKAIVKFLCRRSAYVEAKNLVTETFVVLWRKGDEVPDNAELPWLYKTVGLALSNQFREEKFSSLGDAAESLDSVNSNDPASLVMENQGMCIALAKLSERDREIILAVVWEGLTGQALADYLGVFRDAADVVLSRARRRLEGAIAWST